MKLEIYNFRNVTHRILQFETGIHLFEGESGIGKTTCLEAIQWVLYGGKNVYPFGYDKSKKQLTKVILSFPTLQITRTKPPDYLLIDFDDNKKLEFTEAQLYINQSFGSKIFWESSYYLKQDLRNLLLFGTKEEKNNIVKEIVFGSDSNENTPDKYLEKIDKLIKDLDTQIYGKQSIIDFIISGIKEKEDRLSISQKEISRLKKIYPRKNEIKKKLELINTKILQEKENEKKKLRKVQINMELKDYPELTLTFVSKWKKWLESSQELQGMSNIKKVENIEKIKKQYYELERKRKIYYPNKERIDKLNKYNQSKKLLDQDINYNKKYITSIITDLEERKINVIKYQNYLEKKNSVLKILDQIKDFDKKIKSFTSILSDVGDIENLDEIKEKIMSMKTNLMKCPKCNKNLMLEEGQLKEGKGTLISKKKLNQYKEEYKKLQEYHVWHQEIKSLRKLYSSMRIPDTVTEVTGNQEEIEKYLTVLRSIEVVDYTEEEFREKKEILYYAEIFLRREKLIEIINLNYIPGLENLKIPENIDDYFQKYQSLKEELKIIESNIYYDNDTQLETKREKAEILLQDIDNYEKYLELETEKSKLDSENKELTKILIRREDCLKLKKIIQEESSVTFENLMISFNQILNEIVSEIFEDIQIEIGMFKKMKTKGEIKPQFNMKVTLKGHEYDNLGFLSGGEKDRMSMALMITLAKLGKGQVVMLDETMSSLDEEMRHQILELIKKHLPDKIILIVCHSTIQGFYDSVVSF